ncbi:O-antigen ligase family protein [Thalassotalea sediminis]|uniref:O-antigen ligase family protein n=1 Tax=Thalassotalea sediminis TaxID=1759089 RepID=UPI002572BC88|nr:O-antigen ligase family protein [Thalassotalea sediminis]
MADQALHLIGSTTIKCAKLALFQFTMLMIGSALLVDAVNGFIMVGIGIDIKLSALFKLLLIAIVMFQIGSYSKRALGYLLLLFGIMLIGPLITFLNTTDIVGFFDDLTSGLKIISVLVIIVYLQFIAQKWPDLLLKYGKACLKFSFFVLMINIFLGVLGFGYSSYGGNDGGDDSVGIKGFFYAGNELSGIYIVLFGTMLHYAWQKSKATYFIISGVAIISGVLIATKAAMLAGMLLVFIIPILNERNRMFNLTWLKVKLLVPFLIVVAVLAITIIPILESTGLLGRFIWFYEKNGVLGILLSGRDKFLAETMSLYFNYANWADVVFGFSKTGLGLFTKNAMEIDPIDMYFWHGLVGLLLFVIYCIVMLSIGFRTARLKVGHIGPAVLIINLSLIMVSMIAGHIFTSGMLAPLLALVNGMALCDRKYHSTAKPNPELSGV